METEELIRKIKHNIEWHMQPYNLGDMGETETLIIEALNRLEKYVKPDIPGNYKLMLSGVDEEIRGLVDVLNRNGYETVASCSGHGQMPGNIALRDGRELFIIENYDKARLVNKLLMENFPDNFTKARL